MIRPGAPWGSPEPAAPDLEVVGADAALARAITDRRGALVHFRPDSTSDLAGSVGLAPGSGAETVGTALSLDALLIGDGSLACNMCVLGAPPDRLRRTTRRHEVEIQLDGKVWFAGPATTVVIANGQFRHGLDLVPRGHPGDGRAEVQVYELAPGERRAMRARLATGTHVPHPRIRQRTARQVEVTADPPLTLEIDRITGPPVDRLTVEVLPGQYRLLI